MLCSDLKVTDINIVFRNILFTLASVWAFFCCLQCNKREKFVWGVLDWNGIISHFELRRFADLLRDRFYVLVMTWDANPTLICIFRLK